MSTGGGGAALQALGGGVDHLHHLRVDLGDHVVADPELLEPGRDRS